MQYTGFKLKTINIPLFANGSNVRFQLQQNNELGLPKDAIILGIVTRTHEATYKSSSNRNLADKEVYENAFLTLKSIQGGGMTTEIVGDHPVMDMSERALWIEPNKSTQIDWYSSYISIAPRALSNVTDNAVIELVVIYTTCEGEYKLNYNQKFFTGQCLYGSRRQRYERKLNTSQTQYDVSNSVNIGIPSGSWIVGFSLKLKDFPKTGDVQSAQSFNSTYITLKRGLESIVDRFPVSIGSNTNYQSLLLPALDYIPLQPLPVEEWDFNQSFFELRDNTGVTDNQVFQISLIWVNSHDQRQDPKSI